jgi:hypothetical protein
MGHGVLRGKILTLSIYSEGMGPAVLRGKIPSEAQSRFSGGTKSEGMGSGNYRTKILTLSFIGALQQNCELSLVQLRTMICPN